MLICLKRIYNFRVIHASFVILSHVFTVIYIIFMYFVGLTYCQDAQCQFPVFDVLLFQKFTSENIRGFGPNFTEIIFTPRRRRSPKGGTRGDPEGREGLLPRAHPGVRVGPAPAPRASPRPPPMPINCLLT